MTLASTGTILDIFHKVAQHSTSVARMESHSPPREIFTLLVALSSVDYSESALDTTLRKGTHSWSRVPSSLRIRAQSIMAKITYTHQMVNSTLLRWVVAVLTVL
eukprot:SAG31_NODE_436_length_15717_cov_5.420412_3_plen_104_part_00